MLAPLRGAGVSAESVVWEDPYIDWSSYDLLLIRSTWDYAYRLEAFLDWVDRVSQQAPLFNPPAVLRTNIHKSYLRELRDLGIPTVPTRYLRAGSHQQLASIIEALSPEHGVVVKPVVSNSGRWTIRVQPDAASVSAAEQRIARILAHEEMMAQPFLPQISTDGETSLVAIDGCLTHAVRKQPGEGEFRVQPEHGGVEMPVDAPEDMASMMSRALASTGQTLYARGDFVRADDGTPLLIELELVEPDLFLRHSSDAVTRLTEAIIRRL